MKKVRRSKASAALARASTPIDGAGCAADALERRAKKKAARRKVRRARERQTSYDPLWSAAGMLMGALIEKFVPDVLKAAAAASDDGALLDVAAASLGKITLAPVCCFATHREPKACGQPAPRYYARDGVERGAELPLCEAHAERVRAWMPVTDRERCAAITLFGDTP